MVQQRYVLCALIFIENITKFCIQHTFPLILTRMVAIPNLHPTQSNGEIVCPTNELAAFENTTNTTIIIDVNNDNRLQWSQELQGVVLSSYHWGFLLFAFPGGILTQKYGAKLIFLVSTFFTAIMTALTPLSVQYGDAYGLIANRIIIGLLRGPSGSCLAKLKVAWFPVEQRGRLNAILEIGSAFGGIISLNFAGFSIYYTGRWDYVFYSFAIFATINWTLFALLCYDNPRDHPFIGNEEKKFLEEKINHLEKDRKDMLSTPWIKIFTSKPMIAYIIHASVCVWMFNINNANLPKYMNDVLHISITKNAITSSVPKVAKLIIALFAGFLSDWMLEKKGISITKIRKIFVVLASAFPACFLMCASYAGCDELTVVMFFVLSTGFAGFSTAGLSNNLLDLAPNYVGPLAGLMGTISKTTSIFSTYAVALLTPHAYLSEWRTVFWITFSAKILGVSTFLVWGSGEIQPWNNIQDKGSKADKKSEKLHSRCSES